MLLCKFDLQQVFLNALLQLMHWSCTTSELWDIQNQFQICPSTLKLRKRKGMEQIEHQINMKVTSMVLNSSLRMSTSHLLMLSMICKRNGKIMSNGKIFKSWVYIERLHLKLQKNIPFLEDCELKEQLLKNSPCQGLSAIYIEEEKLVTGCIREIWLNWTVKPQNTVKNLIE